jgi:hypothetical protein
VTVQQGDTIRCDVYCGPWFGDFIIAIPWRLANTGATDTDIFGIKVFSSGYLSVVDGSFGTTDLLSYTEWSVPTNTWLTLELQWKSGNEFTATALNDGTSVTGTSSKSATSGYIGFRAVDSTYFDKYQVSPFVSKPSAPTNLSLSLQ